MDERARRHPAGPVVRVVQAEKAFRTAEGLVHALRGVSLSVARGETVSLTGHSGSGKTALLDLVAGRSVPDAGRVIVAGQDLAALEPAELAWLRNRTVGHIPQVPDLLAHQSVLDNLLAPLHIGGVPEPEAIRRARRLLDKVGLAGRERDPAGRLAATEQQRVLVARALVNAPALLVADEPTGPLDDATAEEIIALFLALRRESGTSLLAATTDSRLLAASDRIVFMAEGVVERVCRREELRITPGRLVVPPPRR